MGHMPFMLHRSRPARRMRGCMVDGTVDLSWGDCLQQQATVIAQAASATAASHHYSQQRLFEKANAEQI